MSATREELEKKLGPTWCFTHTSPVPCPECDGACPQCAGKGETDKSYYAGMAGGNPNCSACGGSGLAGTLGTLRLHPASWHNSG
jgi:hypothetical protein